MTKIPFSPGDRIFCYLRDSGHEDQELSIEQQESALRKWAAEHNLIISHIYKDEAKRGSSTVKRDELQAMMYAFRHECSERGVVVWKYNRFARSVEMMTQLPITGSRLSSGIVSFCLSKTPESRSG